MVNCFVFILQKRGGVTGQKDLSMEVLHSGGDAFVAAVVDAVGVWGAHWGRAVR